MPPRLHTQKTAPTIKFRVNGVDYACHLSNDRIGPALERELFIQAKVTPQQAFEAFASGAYFGLAAAMFIARRQAGEKVVYAQIEAEVQRCLEEVGDEGFDLTVYSDEDEVEILDPPQ